MPLKPVILRAIRKAIRRPKVVCVFVNTESEEEAVRIGQTLLAERLTAAVNILPSIRSIYHWQGRVEDRSEAMMILKTTQRRLKALMRRVVDLHSYQVPSILALSILRGHRPYLDWVSETTDSKGR